MLVSCRPPQPALPDESLSQFTRTLVVERVIEPTSVSGGLRKPGGMAVSALGRLYLADTDNNRVILFDKDFGLSSQAGGFGGGETRLGRPSWLTIDNDLAVLVSDFGNRRIGRFDSELRFVNDIPFNSSDDPLKFSYPAGLFVTSHGEMWVGDRDNARIAVFSVNGQFDRFVGASSGTGLLRDPAKIVLNNQEVMVCDAGNYRIAVYDLFGGFIREFGESDLRRPTGICLVGGMYVVVDQDLNQIFAYNAEGDLIEEFGPLLSGNRIPLLSPTDIVLLPDGRLVISDTGNNRILICRLVEGQ